MLAKTFCILSKTFSILAKTSYIEKKQNMLYGKGTTHPKQAGSCHTIGGGDQFSAEGSAEFWTMSKISLFVWLP